MMGAKTLEARTTDGTAKVQDHLFVQVQVRVETFGKGLEHVLIINTPIGTDALAANTTPTRSCLRKPIV